MVIEDDPVDGFAMAEAVLRHADRHFGVVLAGMDHQEHIWEDPQGNPISGIVYYKAQDVGGELAWVIEIKHCLEDIRSALDYTAFEVYERACCRKPQAALPHVHENVSFPIPKLGEKPDAFEARIDQCIPTLKRGSMATFDALVGLMSRSNQLNDALRSLEDNWNTVKHRHLPKPVRMKGKVVATTIGNPADHPVTEKRLFSKEPPRDVEWTLRYCLLFSREIVETLRRSAPPRKPA